MSDNPLVALLNLGVSRLTQGDLEGAKESATAAYQMAQSMSDNHGSAAAAHLVGDTLVALGNAAEAERWTSKACSLYVDLDLWDQVAGCTESLGRIHFELGDYRTSRDDYERAERAFLAMDDEAEGAKCSFGAATALVGLGNVAAAVDRLRSARMVFIRCGMPEEAADCDENLQMLVVTDHEVEREGRADVVARGFLKRFSLVLCTDAVQDPRAVLGYMYDAALQVRFRTRAKPAWALADGPAVIPEETGGWYCALGWEYEFRLPGMVTLGCVVRSSERNRYPNLCPGSHATIVTLDFTDSQTPQWMPPVGEEIVGPTLRAVEEGLRHRFALGPGPQWDFLLGAWIANVEYGDRRFGRMNGDIYSS